MNIDKLLDRLLVLNDRGFTTRKIAKRIRVGKSTVARWLTGESFPTARNAKKLATFVKKVR